MRPRAVRVLCMAALVAGLVGCQSSPRWAWWKPKAASEDTSLLARSAAPALPSSQSTPQVVESGSLQPAAPPSSANLAAAGGPSAVPTSSIPGVSSGVLATAPVAQYPANNLTVESPAAGVPNVAVAAPPSATGTVPSIAASKSATQPTATNPPAAGPYDPNGYRLSTEIAAAPNVGESSVSGGSSSTPVADRYAVAPTNPASPAATPSADRYAMSAETTAAATVAGDRYNQQPSDRYSQSPAVSSTPATNPVAPAPASAATVQLSAPAGQYRPGGTSSYVSGSTNQQIEVASRPGPTASSNVPPQSAEPASVPWAPPMGLSPGEAPGTHTY